MTTFAAGQTLTAALLNSAFAAISPIGIRKTVDESVSNATTGATLQDDDELLVAVAANTAYSVMAWIIHAVAGTAIDLKTGFTYPTGATLIDGGIGADIALPGGGTIGSADFGVNAPDATSPSTARTYGSGNNMCALLVATLIVGSSAGNLQFQFAQASANATALSVKAGSWLRVTPL